jgi:hypothetical protein
MRTRRRSSQGDGSIAACEATQFGRFGVVGVAAGAGVAPRGGVWVTATTTGSGFRAGAGLGGLGERGARLIDSFSIVVSGRLVGAAAGLPIGVTGGGAMASASASR